MRWGYYLTVDKSPKGDGYLAIISDGQPQFGHDPVTLLTLEVFKRRADAKPWFHRMIEEKPWETRQ